MDWNEEAVKAARDTLQQVGEAVDAVATKATQLEALLVMLMHAARSDDLPGAYVENVCWLASEMAVEIKLAAQRLV